MIEQCLQKEKGRIFAARRTALFLAISTLLILAGGLLTLFASEQQRQQARADDPTSVASGPTLPAATVNQILANSPMAGTGVAIEDAASQYNIDDAFALGVWWTETNFGAAGVGLGYHNPGGVRASSAYAAGNGDYTDYPSYTDAIYDWFSIVKSRYIARGLTTVYAISGPYVGTSSSGSWANKVYNLMASYRAMAPALPTPTPSPTPLPTPTPTPKPEHSTTVVQTAKPATTKTTTQPAAENGQKIAASTFTLSGSQGLFVAGGTLLALFLFGWGCLVRFRPAGGRELLAQEPMTGALAWELPARHTNELSPAVVSVRADRAKLEPQLPFELADFPELSQLPTAKVPAQEPVTAALHNGHNAEKTGLRRVRLHESLPGMDTGTTQTEQLNNNTFSFAEEESVTIRQEPTTESFTLGARPGLRLPGRAKERRELVEVGNRRNGAGVGRGGLLARYGDNASPPKRG